MNFHNLVDIAGLYKGNAAAIELKVVIKTVSSRDAAVDHLQRILKIAFNLDKGLKIQRE